MSETSNNKSLLLGENFPRHYFPKKGPNKDAASVRSRIVMQMATNLREKINSNEADFREAPEDLMEAYEDLIIRMHAISKYETKIALGD